MTQLSRDRQIDSVARQAFRHRLPRTALIVGLVLGLVNGWFALGGIVLYFVLAIALTLNKNFVRGVVKRDRGW